MHNWGASKARLMSGLSAQLQLLDLACHTHSNQPCKNYRLHWFLVFICECAYSGLCVSITVSASLDRNIGRVCVCVRVFYVTVLKHACSARTGYKPGVYKSASGPLRVCWLGLWEAAQEHADHIIIRYGCHTVIISNTHSYSTLLFAAILKKSFLRGPFTWTSACERSLSKPECSCLHGVAERLWHHWCWDININISLQ